MAIDAAPLFEIDHRRLIDRARKVDLAFACAGLLVMVVAMAMLLALIVDLVIDGLPRLSWDFFTSFPSRRASRAGILSAWVGTSLVMVLAVSAFATMVHSMTTQAVDIVLAALLLVGGVVGAQYGARLATRLKPDLLRLALAVIILLVAFRMALGLAWRPDEIYTVFYV